jgi:flagellar basal-body rod modification protein FlgD
MNVQDVKSKSTQVVSQKSSPYVDKEQFLKILVAQMKYQNPFEPMKPDQFLTQLSQLTEVEQLKNIYTSLDGLKEILSQSSILDFASLLGKKVATQSNFMTKGDELYIRPDEDYEKIVLLLTDLSTGEKKEVSIEKGQPLVYRHDGENPVFVSAYATKGNKVISCQIDLFRLVSRIEVEEGGKLKLVFEDGQSTYLESVKKVKQ